MLDARFDECSAKWGDANAPVLRSPLQAIVAESIVAPINEVIGVFLYVSQFERVAAHEQPAPESEELGDGDPTFDRALSRWGVHSPSARSPAKHLDVGATRWMRSASVAAAVHAGPWAHHTAVPAAHVEPIYPVTSVDDPGAVCAMAALPVAMGRGWANDCVLSLRARDERRRSGSKCCHDCDCYGEFAHGVLSFCFEYGG